MRIALLCLASGLAHAAPPTTETCIKALEKAPREVGLKGSKLKRSSTASGETAVEVTVPFPHGSYLAWLRPATDTGDDEDFVDQTEKVNKRDHASWDAVVVRRHHGWEAGLASKGVQGGEGSRVDALDSVMETELNNCFDPRWLTWANTCMTRLGEARDRAARSDRSLRRSDIQQYGFGVELDGLDRQNRAWMMISVGKGPTPAVFKTFHDSHPDRWVPTIYDTLPLSPTSYTARAAHEEAIKEYASGHSAAAMRLFAESAVQERAASECLDRARKDPRLREICGDYAFDKYPPATLMTDEPVGSIPPLEELIFENAKHQFELLGPERPDDAKAVVYRLGFGRQTRKGHARISIAPSNRLTVRAVLREIRPAIDACLAEMPD
jgi:hypothetical protein